MKRRVKKYQDQSPAEFLVLRDRLGLKRYRKMAKRDNEERLILLNLALKKMQEMEKEDYIPLGFRKRKLRIAD